MARDPRYVMRRKVTIESEKGRVIAVVPLDDSSSIGIRFETPEQLLEFCHGLIEEAAKVWPNDPYMQEYLSEE